MTKSILFSFAIVCCFSFTADEDFLSSIKQKADTYFAKVNRAKLELVFNQPRYAPGDTAWFKTSYLKAGDLKPVSGAQIIHIYLFDQYSKKKLARWYSVTNGAGSNELAIPENLSPGNYVLVAFTDWMKNLDNSLFFKQEFVIAGKNLIGKAMLRDTIEFYPEGGQVVSGVENTFAVRYTGNKDQVDVVIKEVGKDIATLKLVKDSVVTFQLTPSLNTEYYAEFLGKKINLPRVSATGISVHTITSGQRATLQLEKTDGDNRELYLLVFNSSGLVFQNRIDFGPDKKKEFILPQNLPSGIAQIVIADSKYNLEASRTIYIDPKPIWLTNISNEASTYSTRQAVGLTLQVKNQDGFSTNGVFSCRVINNDLFQSSERKMDYLTFRSDISNTFEFKKEFATPVTINNYLITQTCPWFDWKKMIEKDQKLQFEPQQYLTLSGKAVYAKSGLPVRDSTLIMFYLEKNLVGYETYTSSKGHFSFPLVLNVNTSDRFFYTATYKGNDVDGIAVKIDDPDSVISIHKQPTDIILDSQDPYFIYRTQRNTINNSYSFFVNPKALSDSTFDSNKAIEDELDGADVTIRLADYLQMPRMEDVVKEILRAVDYRKINDRHVIRVYTTAKRPTNHTGPLYIIDGQITKNPNHFLGLKPADVVSIKLVKDSRKLFALGQLGANGVILVKTKTHTKIHEESMLDYSGLLREFHVKSRNVSLQLPDLRSCLNWTPNIQTSGDGSVEVKFNTSDDVGNFKVQIYGMTDRGASVNYEVPFKVKYQGN